MKQIRISLKNVNVSELEKTFEKCLIWFYSFPRARIGLNDLAKGINASKTATKYLVESLLNTGFLNREIIGKAWLLTANQKHPYFITRKIPYNLTTIYESDIISAIYSVIPSPRAIVLFGSYRWGTDVEESDIDIAVEVLDNKELQIINLGRIAQLGYRKNVPVNIHVFSRNKIDLNLFSNIANGIVLDGFLEVKK